MCWHVYSSWGYLHFQAGTKGGPGPEPPMCPAANAMNVSVIPPNSCFVTRKKLGNKIMINSLAHGRMGDQDHWCNGFVNGHLFFGIDHVIMHRLVHNVLTAAHSVNFLLGSRTEIAARPCCAQDSWSPQTMWRQFTMQNGWFISGICLWLPWWLLIPNDHVFWVNHLYYTPVDPKQYFHTHCSVCMCLGILVPCVGIFCQSKFRAAWISRTVFVSLLSEAHAGVTHETTSRHRGTRTEIRTNHNWNRDSTGTGPPLTIQTNEWGANEMGERWWETKDGRQAQRPTGERVSRSGRHTKEDR